jgi:hypothetical protein
LFSGINSENHTVILGEALLYDEKTGSWKFVLEYLLKQSEGISPDILWSDEDPAIPSAIEDTYGKGSIKHLLYDWHISNCVTKKLLLTLCTGLIILKRKKKNCEFH